MKDPATWPASDATEFERRLLHAARSDRAPHELKRHMAKALVISPFAIASSAAASGIRAKIGTAGAGAGAGGQALSAATSLSAPAAGSGSSFGAATSLAGKAGSLLFSKTGLWGSLTVAALAIGSGLGTLHSGAREASIRAPQAAAASSEVAAAEVAAAPARANSESVAPATPAEAPSAGIDSSPRAAQPTHATSGAVADGSSRKVRTPMLRDAPGTHASLRAELQLLDRVREALRTGANERALALLEEHDRRFERAALGPEADALRIEALIRRGDTERAGRLSQRFLRAHPDHPLAHQVAHLGLAR